MRHQCDSVFHCLNHRTIACPYALKLTARGVDDMPTTARLRLRGYTLPVAARAQRLLCNRAKEHLEIAMPAVSQVPRVQHGPTWYLRQFADVVLHA
jgi:hypothetical protein